MRDAENIRQIENSGVDWMGFIFHPESSRYVSEIPDHLPQKAKRVGVFVNETREKIIETAARFALDLLQLHGNESPELCMELREKNLTIWKPPVPIIKAFSVENDFPIETVKKYEGVCDYFLFDTKTPLHGGSGKKFKWEILSRYKGKTPFLLSGGISPEDVLNILRFNHPMCIGIDINSKFEISPALKDVNLVKRFINKLCQK